MEKDKKIPIVPIVTGEVFLHDKVVDDKHCYVCKKEIDKSNTNDMVLIRLSSKQMGFCCTRHYGVVQEFIKQFDRLPFGWERDNEIKKIKIKSNKDEDAIHAVANKSKPNKYRKRKRTK